VSCATTTNTGVGGSRILQPALRNHEWAQRWVSRVGRSHHGEKKINVLVETLSKLRFFGTS
jgi:hypothetical protein